MQTNLSLTPINLTDLKYNPSLAPTSIISLFFSKFKKLIPYISSSWGNKKLVYLAINIPNS